MKNFILLITAFLLLSCNREEKGLLVPVGTPEPPQILNILKKDLNCSMPFNVSLVAQVNNELGNESYLWTVNGASYSGKSPIIQVNQTGDVTITLRVSNPIGFDVFTSTFNYPSTTLPVVPIFNYGATNNNYRIPAEVNFTDLSQRATGVKWDFGDGYQSNLSNPKHVYTIPGVYTIRLTAYCDSDTAYQTAQLTVKDEPNIIRFDRFEVLSFPRNYFPENGDDNTTGGDFYVELYRDNFRYGTGDVQRDRRKLPLFWRCPQDWQGDYRLIYYSFGRYAVRLWDQNDNADTELLTGIFDGSFLRTNYYPTQLDFESGDLRFRILLAYED